MRVLKVCLAEIDRSRPFLIMLVGDRYGWTPPEEYIEAAAREAGFGADVAEKSVTALEIEFGILRRDPSSAAAAFSYFRDALQISQGVDSIKLEECPDPCP